jgi:AAA domain
MKFPWPLRKIFSSKKSPHEVFTPRAAEVNRAMYVERPDLEKALKNAFLGTRHILIHGESGCGKSWLYKHTFDAAGIKFTVANLANASRLGSVNAEFANIVSRRQETVVSQMDTTEVNVKVYKQSRTRSTSLLKQEPFEQCLAYIRGISGGKRACLVLDNLESIFDNSNHMRELADLITLLDDARYNKYDVKFVIVGVPSSVRHYFSNTQNLPTVSNRIDELPEVSRLSKEAAHDFINRGFIEELGFTLRPAKKIVEHIAWITDRIPERLHEYCLQLALLAAENQGRVSDKLLNSASSAWFSSSLSHAYSVIEGLMNSRETTVGRRNQTLYALGLLYLEEIKYSDIEQIIRKEFPRSTRDVSINVSAILGELARGNHPIIRRSPKGDAYEFLDPKYRMCLRAMLYKTEDETVQKRQHSE